MKRSINRAHMGAWAVAMLLAAALPFAFAADEPKKAAEKPKEKSATQGYYAILANELKLEGDAKAKYEEAIKARAAAIKAWDDTNGAKVKELDTAAKTAKAGTDKAAAKTANDALKSARAPREAIEEEHKKKILAALSPDHRKTARGYGFYMGAGLKFSKATLTDDQKAKVKALALESGKKTSDEMKDADVDKVREDFYAQVSKDILTEDQRTAVATKAPAKKKADEPKKTEEPKKAESK